MRIVKQIFLVAVMGLFLTPTVSHAIAVGLSPATYEIIMLKGDSGELLYTLSRDESDGPFDFVVSVNQDQSFVHLTSDTVSIPAGENTAPYIVQVDSEGLELGEYDATIIFQDNNISETSEEALSIRYGIQGNVVVNIVDESAYLAALMEEGLKINGFYVEGQQMSEDEEVTIRYDIQNPGSVYVETLEHRIQILDEDGTLLEEIVRTDDVNLAPHENQNFTTSFVPDIAGDYVIRAQVYYEGKMITEKSITTTINEKSPMISGPVYNTIFIIAIVSVAAGILLTLKKKGS